MIGCPVEEVFAVVRDVTTAPRWNPGLLEVRRTSEGPLGVGATMIYVGTFLGRRYESPVACTVFAENKHLAAGYASPRSGNSTDSPSTTSAALSPPPGPTSSGWSST